MKKKVTMRDIAGMAGVSHVTVSLALRNHGSIPKATKARIEKIAKELHYRPDPMLSALNAYRASQLPLQHQGLLAWIDVSSLRETRQANPIHELLLWKGAERRSRELGFHLEKLKVSADNISSSVLIRTLHNRRIKGVILPPLALTGTKLDLPWQELATVALGFSNQSAFDVITNAQYQNAQIAVRNLHRLGYRRIGFTSLRDMAERTNYNFLSGVWSESTRLGISPFILYLSEKETITTRVETRIISWLKRLKLDALLTAPDIDGEAILKLAGYQIPRDIALAKLDCMPAQQDFAGIHQNPEQIGVVAINHLVDLLKRGEIGLPQHPVRLLVEGEWLDGLSAPERNLTHSL